MWTRPWRSRRPARRRGLRLMAIVAAIAMAAASACGGDDDGPRAPVVATVSFPEGTEPVPLAALGDGRIAVGERLTGAVRVISASGRLEPQPLATVDVEDEVRGQRGLVGLAATGGGRVFAAWTRAADGRMEVAEVAPQRRTVWVGPVSSRLANGGHLVVLGDGRMVIGIGDLQERKLLDDPTAPHGKLLALDPDGSATQTPEVLGGGWNNPYAFTVTRAGRIWVADNSPGDAPERLGGPSAAGAVKLAGKRAPSALVELAPGRLGLCGYLDGDLVAVDVAGARPVLGAVLVEDRCRTGAVVLGDGRVAVSDARRVSILELDGADGPGSASRHR